MISSKMLWIAAVVVILAYTLNGPFLFAQSGTAEVDQSGEVLPGGTNGRESQNIGYALGLRIGEDLKNDGLQVDINSLAAGLIDAYQGNPPKLDEQAIDQAMQQFQRQMQTRARTKMSAAGSRNKQEEIAFLAKNRNEPGVTETASGLQYKVIQPASGPSPTKADTVSCHYKGTLLDGTEFDSSYGRGRPASFPVGGVIAGWTEALQKMKVGEKWQLFIPADLAYGANPPGPPIEPHSLLLFEIELLGIE